jgi:dipeptidyl aminopeptidase/acylaminoacyl peptidase
MLVAIDERTLESLELIDPASGERTRLDLPFVMFGSLGWLDTHTVFAIGAARDEAPQLFTLAVREGRAGDIRVVRAAGERLLPPEFVAEAEAVEFATVPGADGTPRTAHAWFHPPRHPRHVPPAGTQPPLVMLLHGGPTGSSGCAFKPSIAFWTSRGFAVVDVNYGGSAGFGRAYRERLRGEWGVVDLADAVAAVDHLAATGRVDGGRVVIRGGSAGGFTVLNAIARTRRFAAGINHFGVADLETLAADTHKFESRYCDGLVAPLPEGLPVYRARSPQQHMQHCRAALLTLQGSDDRAVPPEQSRRIVQAAREAGCAVAYLEFEGEGHGFRQGANVVRAWQAELAFLGRVFGFVPAGEVPPLAIENEEALGARSGKKDPGGADSPA